MSPVFNRYVKCFLKISFVYVAMPVFSFSLVFGQISNAWAQQNRSAGNNILEVPVSSSETEHHITLNDITFWDVSRWAILAIIAPELLDDVVPVYSYRIDDVLSIFGNDSNSISNPNITMYLGLARQSDGSNGEDNSPWVARPYNNENLRRIFNENYVLQSNGSHGHDDQSSGSGSDSTLVYSHVVSIEPIDNIEPIARFWVDLADWTAAQHNQLVLP